MKIKKIILGISFCISTLMVSNIRAFAQNDLTNETFLGQTINTIEAESYGDISKYNVLSQSFCKSLDYYCNTNVANSYSDVIHSSSKSEVKKQIQKNTIIESSINNLPIKMFSCCVKEKFEFENSEKIMYQMNIVKL